MEVLTRSVGGALLCTCAFLAACGPSEEKKALFAEKKRVDCLDKICEGDVVPRHDTVKEFAFKVNGEWFIGPREYGGYGGSFAFFWPSKVPAKRANAERQAPEFIPSAAGRNSNFYDVGIEIFLTGRQRWPTPKVEKPWDNSSWDRHFGELQVQGLRMERATLKAGLDLVRFRQPDGKPHNYSYYVATDQQRIRGSGPPVLSCLAGTPPRPDDFCTSGEFWQPDVYADFRFNIKHASDWPAIYQEIVRVLNLSRKAQP